ncbi:MAG: hypothetical protein ACPGVI_04130 [Crocinitomicaceae bacterium]
MKTYNKLMLYFWLLMAAFLFIVVTYMAITEGFRKWAFYYVFAGIALLMFIVRRWMIKRMEKHLKYLEEQNQQEQ